MRRTGGLAVVRTGVGAKRSRRSDRSCCCNRSIAATWSIDDFTGNFRVDLDRRAEKPVNVVQVVVGPTGFVGASEQAVVDFIRSTFRRSSQAGPYRDGRRPGGGIRAQVSTAALSRYAAPLRGRRSAISSATRRSARTRLPSRSINDFPRARRRHSAATARDQAGLHGDGLRTDSADSGIESSSSEFARFRDRLTFIWSDDLSLPEILRRCASLPDHSAIFYVTFGTDAAGAAYADERVFADLHATANAPLFAAHSVLHGRRYRRRHADVH